MAKAMKWGIMSTNSKGIALFSEMSCKRLHSDGGAGCEIQGI